jgi:hypothetical protein
MFPRYRHTPIFDSQRRRCPICNQSVYSLAGIHPQCAIKLEEGPQSRGKKEAAAEAEAPVLVEVVVAQAATKTPTVAHSPRPGPGFRSNGVKAPNSRPVASKASHQGKR